MKKKMPSDPNQLAKFLVDSTTEDKPFKPKARPSVKKQEKSKNTKTKKK
jgi:hypothetical protein